MSEPRRTSAPEVRPSSPYTGGTEPIAAHDATLPADAESAQSWEQAMARASAVAGEPKPSQPAAPHGVGSDGTLSLTPQGDDMPSAGQVTAPAMGQGAAPGEVSSAGAGGSQTLVNGVPVETQQPARGAVGNNGTLDGTMTQEEFLEYRMRRIALGLEPPASSAASTRAADAAGETIGSLLARPVSLVVPVGDASAALTALAATERPVSNDQSASELAGDRAVQLQQSEQQALLRGAEMVAQQLHLEVVNTPESLPLETLKSV